MAATNSMVAGIYNLWVAKRDSNGYPKGTASDPDSPSTNTVYGAHRIKAPVAITPPEPSYETAVRQGGQAVRGQRDLGISNFGTGTIELDGYDETFHALITGSTVDTSTVSTWTVTAPNMLKPSRQKFVMGCSIGMTTEAGATQYATYIWSNVTIRPRYPRSSQSGGTNPNTLTYEFVPDTSTRTGLGGLFSAWGVAVTDNTDAFILVRYTYEIMLATYIANGVATSFTLPFKPVSSDATGAASNYIALAGVIQAVSSVNTGTGAISIVSPGAGSSGDIWTVGYPTAWVAT